MQAYISTSRLVAFNIHPKQHNVMENQQIMRDEEKTVYIPGFLQQKEKQASALPMSFPPSLTLGNGSFFWAKTLYNSSLLLLLSLSGSSLVLLSKKNPPPSNSSATAFLSGFSSSKFSAAAPFLLLNSFCSHLFVCLFLPTATFSVGLLQLQKSRLIPYGH